MSCGKNEAFTEDILYSDSDQLSQVAKVEQQLNVEAFLERFENMTDEDLKNAAEMFIYLNTCVDTLKPWFIFYKELLQNSSPEEIILTLNRIMKGGGSVENNCFKTMALKLLMFSKSSLEYENIQNILSSENLEADHNIPKSLSIEGIIKQEYFKSYLKLSF